MLQKIERFLFKRKYIATYRKEGHAYTLEAGLVRQDIKDLTEMLNINIKTVNDKREQRDKLEIDLKKLEGDAYTESRKEFEALCAEIDSIEERNKDLQTKVLPARQKELGSKLQAAQNAYYKSKQVAKAKL